MDGMLSGRGPSSALVRAAYAGVLVYLLVCVLLGMTRSGPYLAALSDVASLQGILRLGLSACAFVAISAVAWHISRRRVPMAPAGFLLLLIAASLSLRGGLAQYIEPQWISDYLRYWQRAQALSEGARDGIRDLYDQRALLVAYPVASIFDGSATQALKFVNSLLLLAVQLITYDFIRRHRDHQAAQAASILLLAAPLPALTTLIPSHDLWGMFFFALSLWAFSRAAERKQLPMVIAWTMVAAGAAYLLEIQRTLGTLLSVSFVAASLLGWLHAWSHGGSAADRRPWRTGVLVAIACVGLQPAIGAIGKKLEIHPGAEITSSASHYMKLAAHSGAMGTATSDWYARFADRFADKALQGDEATADFAKSVALSTWVNAPDAKVRHLAHHAPRLFDLGYPQDWDAPLRRPAGLDPDTRATAVYYVTAFGVGYALLFAIALLVLTGRGRLMPLAALAGVVFLAAVSFLLLALFENKPPNILPIWMVTILIVGLALGRGPVADSGTTQKWSPHLLWAGAIALALAGVLAWLLALGLYKESDGRVLTGWNVTLEQDHKVAPRWDASQVALLPRAFEAPYYLHDRRGFVLRGAAFDGQRLQQFDSELYQLLEFPAPLTAGDRIELRRELCAGPDRTNLEMFVFAPLTRTDVDDRFRFSVAVDGRVQQSLDIPFDGPNIQLLTIPLNSPGTCSQVSLSVLSNVTTTSDSWRRASRVEIWMPRLAAPSGPDH